MTRKIAVLMGGWSAEREVSLVSGAAVANALKEAGFSVTTIDVQRDMGSLLTRLYPRPDVVFNALHGRYGEDGCVQGFLNILGIPYTHSGLMASAVAMDKAMAKSVMSAAGLPVADHVIATRDEVLGGDVMARPYVVKPNNEGSSVGIHIVTEDSGPILAEGEAWALGDEVMVEAFIPGRELTVTVMGDRPLTITEITTNRGFYDYDAKYASGGSAHTLPAELPKDVEETVLGMAQKAHDALGCRGLSRVDFRWDDSKGIDGLYILEINTQPGMTPTSLAPEQAEYVGISFAELTTWMVEQAQCDA